MRDRRARVVIVGILLTFPLLMVGMSPRTTSVREAALPVLATEAILIAGLSGASRERQRLLAERSAPVSRLAVPSVPHPSTPVARSLGRAPVGR